MRFNRRNAIHAAVAVVSVSMLSACAAGCTGPGGSGTSSHPPEDPVPAPYTGLRNPLPHDAATIAHGHELFVRNCAPCHGSDADGKGPASTGLTPPPANFLDGVRLSSHSDAYLFYRVSTGKHGTAMPSFAGVLPENDRWTILRFLRSLPGAKEKEDE